MSPWTSHRPLKRMRKLVPAGVVTALVIALSGCNANSMPTFGQPRGADVQGNDIFKLYSGFFIAGLIVSIFVWGLIFWSVIKYRRRKSNEGIPKQFQEHIALEITYTVIPVIIVIFLFIFTVITENRVDNTSQPAAAVVNVTGFQWGWTFKYAGHGANGITLQTDEHQALAQLPQSYTAPMYPQLVIPLGESTHIFLRSNDVIHDFFVHEFNFDRFAQPGVVNQFDFTPTRLGTFPAQCSEYCGLYHSEMLFSVKVVTPAQYRQWVQQHTGNSLRSST